MKNVGLAVVALILAFGGLMMLDGIMAALGTELIPISILTAMVGFVFVLASGLFLSQVKTNKD